MDNFNINISPESHRIDISRQELVKIDKKIETFELNYDGPVVNIDARYDEAVRIITEGLEDFNANASEKLSGYNSNATEKLNAYNTNASEKLGTYNSNASEKLSEFNDNYTEKKALIDAQVDIAEEQANIATIQAQTATVQASSATASANRAFVSETNAKTSELSAYNSEQSASQSATTATTQAGIATTKAGEASTSASNALASETSASNSALSASNSANLAKQWAIGDPSEPAGNSAKYWADYAEEIAQQIGNPANKDLSNLSATGNSRFTNLQTQIDAIVSSSDVFDIVGTYAELQAYDISTVPVNDIIKVLVDSTHSGAATYYRCIETAGVKSWNYIGSEGAYYTKGETDGKFSTILATGSSLDYTGNTLSLENAQGTVLSSVTIQSSPDLDNKSITKNTSKQLQTIGVINSRDSSTAIKTWTGTKAQYNAITTKDPNTLYNITDDTDVSLTILKALYPVGSVYITTASTCPLSALISGSTWTLQSSAIVTSVNTSVPVKGTGKTLGLTDGTNNYGLVGANGSGNNAFAGIYNTNVGTTVSGASTLSSVGVTTDASKSGIVGTVTRSTLAVNIFRRTA